MIPPMVGGSRPIYGKEFEIVRIMVGALLLLAAATAAGIAFSSRSGNAAGGPEAGKMQLAATIFPLADWLREVAGEDAEVHCLVSAAKNPHHFEPSAGDAVRVTRSRALFAIGLGLDPWAAKLAANSGNPAPQHIEVSAWIVPRPIFGAGAKVIGSHVCSTQCGDGQHDPHFWLDPARAITVVERLAVELGKLDPPHAEGYARRAAAYVVKLKALDAEVQSTAKTIAPGRKAVTFHDAYGYLFERLGIELAAVVQHAPGIEPSPRDVSGALRVMREIGQRTVFSEPAGTPAAKAIAKELGAETATLDPLDTEWSDAGKNYLERMRHNLVMLGDAFGGR